MDLHEVSSSGYYLLRVNDSATPEYTYCDFEFRAVSKCLEIGEQIESPIPGYYLIKPDSIAESTYVYCDKFNPKSCQDVDRKNSKIWKITGGVFDISPNKNKQIEVYCDLTADGEGWTVSLHRIIKKALIPIKN
ncbi:uncharacterized protein LOC120341333 [Styela clava]